MIEQTESKIDCGRGGLGEGALKSGIVACLSCRHEAACRQWLSRNRHKTVAPAFCPNATRLNRTLH